MSENCLCRQCGRERSAEEIRRVDGEPICVFCLSDAAEAMIVWPIGRVVNNWKSPKDVPADVSECVSEIRLAPGQVRFCKGLADEKHLTIVWALHRSGDISTSFPRRLDGKIVGPFASRTPHRFTPIAVTDVDLISFSTGTLTVKGLDAIDGSPVLDIKLGPKTIETIRAEQEMEK